MIFTCFSEFIKMCSKVTGINCSSGLSLSEGWGGGGGKLSRLVYLAPPPPGVGSNSVISYFCSIVLEYLVVRDVNIISVKLSCLYLAFSSVILVRRVGGKLSRLVYLALRQDLGQTVSSSNVQFGYPCLRGGGGASYPGWFILPHTMDLSQAVSSVNSYCTITLEYLVVRDVNIISVKLRCLHLTFSLVILVRGVGGKLLRLVYLAPSPGFGSNSVIS